MAGSKDDCILFVSRVADSIVSLNLNSEDGWKRIFEELDIAIGLKPDGDDTVTKALDLCKLGLRRVFEHNIKDPLTALDCISETLEAIEAFLGDKSNRLAESINELSGFIEDSDINIETDGESIPAGKSTDFLSLNDIAVFIINLKPEDVEGFKKLLAGLAAIEKVDSRPRVKELLQHSAVTIENFLKNGGDGAKLIQEIGVILDEAMEFPDMAPQHSVISQKNAESAKDTVQLQPVQEKQAAAPVPEPVKVTEDLSDYMPKDVDFGLLEEFVTEGLDLIAQAEESLLVLEGNPDDTDAVGTVFRAFHTVKGTSAFLELTLIAEMGHHAESLLSRVRDKEIRYAGGYADLSLRSLDMIKELINAVKKSMTSGCPLVKPKSYDDLMEVLAHPEAAGVSDADEHGTEPVSMRLGDILVASGKVDRDDLEKALAQSEGSCVGAKILRSSTANLMDVASALRTQKRINNTPSPEVDSTVRVSTERLDQLINMVGELVVAHSMVSQDAVLAAGEYHDLMKKITLTSKIVRELQDMGMSMRMVPLKPTFQKMTRLVRDVAKKVGKTVVLITEGEDTEIDRNMVDVIKDPLVHMVRNAVDHGIEAPEARIASGKSETGRVKLSAYHSAGSVVVEIQDDGKGMNRDAILAKAREKGLVAGDGANMSDREVFNFVLEPGFSTAQVVTDVSGRGVGMDVVKKNIESLRGQVEISSEFGRGSTFKMRLPLTLAIIDGMVIKVAGEVYVLPTVSIVRSVKPNPSDISVFANKNELLSLQGKLVPLVRLANFFGREAHLEEQSIAFNLVVVIEDDGRQVGLVIDELVGRQQIVIKSLGESLRKIPGISGGAIMPDGRVGLILDVGGIIKTLNRGGEESDSNDIFIE